MTQPLRFSHLKKYADSPAHYKHATSAESDASWLRKGSATHALVYGTPPVICYPGRRSGKEWDAYEAEHRGSVITIASEYEPARAMADAVRNDPMVQSLRLLRPTATIETTITWDCDGIEAQSTPDLWDDEVLVDLKTTRCAKPSWFLREMMKRYYPHQLRFYGNAIESKIGKRPKESYVIAVESVAPHPVVVYRMKPAMLTMAQRQLTMWIEEHRMCVSAGTFPGYVSHVVDVDVPEWAISDDEENEEGDQ